MTRDEQGCRAVKRILMEGEIEKIYIQLVQGKTQNIEVLENVSCLRPCHTIAYRTSVCQRMKNITHTPVYADIR